MLHCLQLNMQMFWWFLNWKYSKYTLKTEQHFQDVYQKVLCHNILDSFDDHFAQNLTYKPITQKCQYMMSFEILSTVNHIGLMKTWGKSSYTLCMKDRIEIIDCSQRRCNWSINIYLNLYEEYHHIQIFHRFTWNLWSFYMWKSML